MWNALKCHACRLDRAGIDSRADGIEDGRHADGIEPGRAPRRADRLQSHHADEIESRAYTPTGSRMADGIESTAFVYMPCRLNSIFRRFVDSMCVSRVPDLR